MGWELLDRPKTLKVTKALAKQFVEMDPAPHDRPLSERRLQVYERLLAAGQFRPVTWASAICTETGGLYRVNGKHTSVLLSGLEKLPDFFVTVEEYECDTLEDVAKLYATFDSKMQSRTANDIYLSFAATVPELREVPSKIIWNCASGIAYHKYGSDVYGRTQPAERAEVLLEYPEFVLWLAGLLGTGGADSTMNSAHRRAAHIGRQPVVAAMFASWSKSKSAATEFWTAVRDETGASPLTPDRKLARYLVTAGLRTGTSPRLKTAGVREMYVKCLHAWNAWRKGETTNLNYHPESKVPAAQ